MSRQSRPSPPALLLTRPAAQNARFSAQLTARFGTGLQIVDSPLLAPRFLKPAVPPGTFDALVFTSETGVEAFRRLSAGLRGVAWCVGLRTAAAARAAGFVARDGGGDARTMARRILAARPGLSVLVVRGRDQAVDVSEALAQGGATPQDLIVYAQEVQALNDAARALLQAEAPVVAPLFSARTAAHLAALPDIAGRRCALRIAALSPAVADAARPARPERIVIAARPEADALIAALAEWYGTERQP